MTRNIILLLVLIILIEGCGKKDTQNPAASSTETTTISCSDKPFLGNWYEPSTGSLFTFYPNCTGIEQLCGYVFTYKLDPYNTSKADVIITQSNLGAGCLTTGTVRCDFYRNATGYYYGTDEEFYLNCGFGLHIYQR